MECSTYEPALFIEVLSFIFPCKVFGQNCSLRIIREKFHNKLYVNIDYKSILTRMLLSNHLSHCDWEVIIYIQASLAGLISLNLSDPDEDLVTANYF